MAEGRVPIKVGTGYIEIVPKVNQKDMTDLRTKLSQELEKLGVQASRQVSSAVKKGLSTLPAEAAKQAKKASAAVEKEAKDTEEAIRAIEKQLTKEYGQQTAKRFRDFQKRELDKQKLVEKASAQTKKAIADAVRLEEKANKDRLTSAQRLERERTKLTEKRVRDQQKALKAEQTEAEKQAKALLKQNKMLHDAYAENERRKRKEAKQTHDEQLKWNVMLERAYAQNEKLKRAEAKATAAAEERYRREVAQAYAENERRNQAAIRQTQALQRQAMRENIAQFRRDAAEQRTALQGGIADQQARMAALRNQITDVRRQINSTNNTTQTYFTRTGQSLKKMGTWFDTVGMSINEAGNILATRFLAPLAMAGTALTAIGVQSADQRLLGQLGLSAAGVSRGESSEQMKAIQQYAIDTPFSVDIMHEYQMKLIRSVAGSDKKWLHGNTQERGKAADSAAIKTTDLIQAIGDSMANAGNLAPAQFQRAMYAMDMIMDMDRAPTKNVRQLIASTGIPAAELAALLGFKSSSEMYKVMGTPAKDGGGITGKSVMDSMLNYWDPKKYDSEGNYSGDGTKGTAERMTSETISGRIQQMKERAQFELGNLFVDEESGAYGYTPLGEKLMGKDTVLYDEKGNVTGMSHQDGILDQVQNMAKKYGPDLEKFLGLFLDSLQSFIEMIDNVASFFKENPVFAQVATAVGRFLVEWGPLILAVGLLSKVLGKSVGLVGKLFQPVGAAARGTANAGRGANSIRTQVRDRQEARRAARAAGGSRSEVREAGRTAYRDRRTANRDGDTRSAGRRAVDGFLGRDSNVTDLQRQMQELDDEMRQARATADDLRSQIRSLNEATLQSINNRLGGSGNNSLQGAASNAQNALRNTVTQGTTPLNNASLSQVQQEIRDAEDAARRLVRELTDSASKVNSLNGAKLDSVTTEVTQLKSVAEDAGKHITSANTRVGNLNGKKVNDVTSSVDGLRNAAKQAADQIGDGAIASSTSGRTANLNKRRLTDIINEFKKLTNAADDSYQKIGQGTGAGSLAGRIGLLNGRSLKKVTDAVKALGKALGNARDEGDGLDGALESIGNRNPGGGGGNKGNGSKKNARGGVATRADMSRYGVLPGYKPWVDNIPAILSPGEAVLRPEVTNHLGEDQINTWNAMAVRGQLSRHATGGVVGSSKGKLDLEAIKNMIDLNIAPIGAAATKTMGMHSSSDPLGGQTQQGILKTGDASSRFLGSSAGQRFKGSYDWITTDVWDQLKRLPTVVGQVAGVLGGAVSPVLGDYFWDDVWKGEGNILSRGQTFLGDVFSTKTLGKVWDNLLGGSMDSLSSLWNTGKAIVTDPFGVVDGAISDIFDVVKGSYNNLVGMVDTVKGIKENPVKYATRTFTEFMSTAKENMPNTEGLFDFKSGSRVNMQAPDSGMSLADLPQGKGSQKWAMTATQALSMLGLPLSALSTVLYRINMESGGNPNIVNKWDSNWAAGHPSVGLMQVIGPTYDAYAGPFRNTGPKLYGTSVNPLANIYAGLNYARNRYGAGWQRMLAGKTGYASGTMSASPGLAVVGEKGRELIDFGSGGQRVYNNAETEALLGKKYEIHVHEARNEPTPQAVIRALQQAEALYL